jgi:hypothetical protein
MDPDKSLDDSIKIIAALLHDVHTSHGVVFNNRAYRLTLNKLSRRARQEGFGFLAKTMPRLGKGLDKALAEVAPLNCIEYGFKPIPGTKLPIFMGEFFSRVLQPDGTVRPDSCANCVKVLRELLYLFYKYKLPYTEAQEQLVVDKFERTEDELTASSVNLKFLELFAELHGARLSKRNSPPSQLDVVRKARRLLQRLFAFFDPTDIYPRHGPGSVATRQQLWSKYVWSNISSRITDLYPADAYFYASLGHVCDDLSAFNAVGSEDLSARVLLVPKDSRGPRLISCEPVDFQWIQQGLGRAIVQLVERHPLTKENVRFTDQEPNRNAALAGSATGKYATLDLNEASDRVSLDLVRLLFPEYLYRYLEACRSVSTELPSGKVIKLKKFAPMGSSLCFPILALTTWAILAASAPDAHTRERVYVYGDDVIVPTAFAVNAIEQLESFGLKVNRDKSCISGLFRESCGMDAFKGNDVTPVRLRTVWSSHRSPDVYTSWIAYANSFWNRRYYSVYNLIVDRLLSIYGPIPSKDMHLACPSLESVPEHSRPTRARTNKRLQKREFYVWDVKSPSINKRIGGWSMLLRYFAEKANDQNARLVDEWSVDHRPSFEGENPFSAGKSSADRLQVV